MNRVLTSTARDYPQGLSWRRQAIDGEVSGSQILTS
jgi:hypothetical protein